MSTKATYTLQRHMRQFVKKKRKYPAAVGKAIVKKGGDKPLHAGPPPVDQMAVQPAEEKTLDKEVEAEEKAEREDEELEETTVKEVEDAAMPVLTEKAPTSEIKEEQEESPAPTSQELSKMAAAKFLPRRFSQELPSDLFEVDHSLSRPASRASFPSRPVSRTSPIKPLQSPSTEDVGERRPSKHCLLL